MSRRSSHGPTAIRRRRIALLLMAVLALVVGVAVGASGGGDGGNGERAGSGAEQGAPSSGGKARGAAASDGDDAADAPAPTPAERAQAQVARMSLERQVGQLLVISFSGTRAPAYVTQALRAGRAAGVILFGGNAPSAASVRALSASVQRAAGGDAIVSLDQEGGDIRTLKFAPPQNGQASQPDARAARASARTTAAALRDVGVDVTLGPVADVAAGTPGSFMAGRAFPGDADAVADSVGAAVGTYLDAGIEPVPKHFPGVGGATQNTDFGSTAVERTSAQLRARDLVPYRAALDAGARIVMVGHARYPRVDPDDIASQSRAIVTGLLRQRLGFDGVVMTDSLEAEAVDAATPGDGDVAAAALRSLQAGDDLMLLTGPGSFPRVREALIAAARRTPAIRARVAESAARVVELRARLARAR
ncbi:glycoside hydrolase family 3 N-terminal domain-containing protein [Conexibacter sp. CPCC 206217]|uniref:glycoside hydrolase family 3 N-terminal domain-containing protein n=1 Tax=Conexibacter sp. CPCC 206217 TaxID=3064574 RepID=UPI00271B4C56|nr:glycoside hydrolase family 3 N-terminal domain-containing protein [Conexibacter sp. CPCC 206217]MDO8213356.1 glycoside hydrolase family 3 N-terminal domain-containing protein [Conexibacter sp. CPCC 206217]